MQTQMTKKKSIIFFNDMINIPNLNILIITLLCAIFTNCQQKQDIDIKRTSYLNTENPYSYKHPVLNEADSLGALGPNYYEKSLEKYLIAAEKLKKIQDWEGYAWALIKVCTYFQQTNILKHRWREAKPFIDTLVNLVPNKLNLGEFHPFIGSAYYCKGAYHFSTFEVDSAEYAFLRAYNIRSQFFKSPNLYTAAPFFGLAEVALELEGDLPKAIEYQKKGELILSQSDSINPAIRNYFKANGFKMFMDGYKLRNNHDKSISFAYKIIDSLNLLREDAANLFQLIAYNTIGDNLLEKGLYRQAKDVLEVGQNTFINSTSYSPNEFDFLFNNLKLGEAYASINNEEKAFEQLDTVINILNNLPQPDSEILKLLADAYYVRGNFFINKKNYKAANSDLSYAKVILADLKAPLLLEEANVLVSLGDVQQGESNFDTALTYYNQALHLLIDSEQVNDYGIPDINAWWDHAFIMSLLRKKGNAYYNKFQFQPTHLENLDWAYQNYKRAIELLVNAFFYIEREADQVEFTKKSYTLFEKGLDCLYLLDSLTHKKENAFLALELVELSKAKSLFKDISELNEIKKIDTDNSLMLDNLELRGELAYLQAKVKSLEKENQSLKKEVISKYYARILELEKKKRVKGQQVLDEYMPFKSAGLDPYKENDKFKEIVNSHANFLSYFWGEKHCYIIRGSNGIYTYYRTTLRPGDSSKITDLLMLLKKGYINKSENEDFKSYHQKALMLFKKYVAILDMDNLLDKPIEILIFRDGPLTYIPFEALIIKPPHESYVNYKDLDYFMNYASITYEMSFNILEINKNKKVQKAPQVLAFNYDTISNNTFKNQDKIAYRSGNSNLPGSTMEVKEISKYFPTVIVPDSLSSKAFFLDKAAEYDVLLLSIHGALDSVYGSKLIFKGIIDASSEQELYPYEILELPLKARLAILSACESGLGENIPGEGMYSMSRSFLRAGCPTIIMSLWQVPDKPTANVMVSFYQFLSNGKKPNESLRKAKLTYINTMDWRLAHPGNWAGMIVMGDTQAITTVNAQVSFWNLILNNYEWIIVIAILITLLLFGLKKRKT